MLVDTDVLIWHLRGHVAANQRLSNLPSLIISAVTWLELLQGFRNRMEMQTVQKSLEMRHAKRLPLTPVITEQAIGLMEHLALSHGLQLGDALIAATALTHNLTLLTANVKHFSSVDSLKIEAFRP
jgi:predicted nucleic acid-binding protein